MENREQTHIGEKHIFVDTVILPTCTASGHTRRTCSICGYSYTSCYVPAAHKFQVIKDEKASEKSPTCTEGAVQILECKECKLIEEREIPPLGHEWGQWVVDVFPTCLEPGRETRKCNHRPCQETQSRAIPATGHKRICPRKSQTQKGVTEYFCANCGETVLVKTTFRKYAGWIIAGISVAMLALLAAIILPIVF